MRLNVSGLTASDEVPAVEAGPVEPPKKRLDRPGRDRPAPGTRTVVFEAIPNQLAQRVKVVNDCWVAQRIGKPDRRRESLIASA